MLRSEIDANCLSCQYCQLSTERKSVSTHPGPKPTSPSQPVTERKSVSGGAVSHQRSSSRKHVPSYKVQLSSRPVCTYARQADVAKALAVSDSESDSDDADPDEVSCILLSAWRAPLQDRGSVPYNSLPTRLKYASTVGPE